MTQRISEFKKSMEDVRYALINVYDHVESSSSESTGYYDYKEGRGRYLSNNLKMTINSMRKAAWKLSELHSVDVENQLIILKILNKMSVLKVSSTKAEILECMNYCNKLLAGIRGDISGKDTVMNFPELESIPGEIVEEITADLNEIRKCFEAESYRSCVIICGRILEAALYRKYYDVSKNDLLETSPGLGLGKLVAKLAEKNVHVDPGLNSQIHLINQVRIYSVHKKKEPFYPSKSQAHAMILYTLDIVNKLFS